MKCLWGKYVGSCCENSDSIQVDIQLENLTIGETYIVKKRQINSEYGCVLTEWAKMGMAVDLERSDIKYIEGRCVPNLEREQRKAEAGNVEISCESPGSGDDLVSYLSEVEKKECSYGDSFFM